MDLNTTSLRLEAAPWYRGDLFGGPIEDSTRRRLLENVDWTLLKIKRFNNFQAQKLRLKKGDSPPAGREVYQDKLGFFTLRQYPEREKLMPIGSVWAADDPTSTFTVIGHEGDYPAA